MKLFHFYRVQDHSGVSGTGPVVEGVQFTNGWCALRWISNKSSICFYQSIDEVKAIHGHGGKTEIVMHDFEPLQKTRSGQGGQNFEILLDIIEEASRLTTLAEDRASLRECQRTIGALRILVDELAASVSRQLRASA